MKNKYYFFIFVGIFVAGIYMELDHKEITPTPILTNSTNPFKNTDPTPAREFFDKDIDKIQDSSDEKKNIQQRIDRLSSIYKRKYGFEEVYRLVADEKLLIAVPFSSKSEGQRSQTGFTMNWEKFYTLVPGDEIRINPWNKSLTLKIEGYRPGLSGSDGMTIGYPHTFSGSVNSGAGYFSFSFNEEKELYGTICIQSECYELNEINGNIFISKGSFTFSENSVQN